MLLSQSRSPAYHFDFGPEQSVSPAGSLHIAPSTLYTAERSFGLLRSDSLMPVQRPNLVKALGAGAADGLSKDGPILFRVDLPKGSYAVEIMMDGGSRETWSGEVSINDKILATSLESFGYSAESEYAPPYWACLRVFENDADYVILRIQANKQRTSINSVSFFPYKEGPVRYDDGVFRRNSNASAPNFDLALKLINAGKTTEATRIIDAIPQEWNLDRAHLLMALASRLETQTPRQFIEAAFAILSSEYTKSHDESLRLHMRLAELCLKADQHYKQAGWEWAREFNGMGIFGNCEITGMSSAEVASIPQHPLWLASVWQLAKTCYWLWVEQHVDGMIVRADSLFRLLQQVYPDHSMIKAYLADPNQAVTAVARSQDAPRWAELQIAVVNRLKGVIHYWSESRQGSSGEFGGKYDDDVEMMRWWPFARVALDDSITLVGMKRLVDGIWKSDWIFNGWCKKVRDVEHSSEPVADTQPMMIGFDYGNPIYVERCMQSLKLALDLWTAKNSKGHRHFKSSWYSSTVIDATKPKNCDLAMNTRTVKAIRWFAWYTRHPEALRFLQEWADAWLDDCLRTEKGKPAGIVPAAIRFSDDAIGGHADNWHHPGLFWDYFDYQGGNSMLTEFLSCYRLFGDRKYLKPIELSLDLVRKHISQSEKSAKIGSEAWAAAVLRDSGDFWEVAEVWRLLTGDTRFDDLLMKNGSPYLRYRLGSKEQVIENQLTTLLREVDRNYALVTTEGYFTDRIEMRELRGRDDNVLSLVESMYLGAPLVNLFYPFSAVFWKNTDSTMSALVEESSPASIRIRTFNHSTVMKSGEVSFLQLDRGDYEITQGIDTNKDGQIDQVRKKEAWTLTQRNGSYKVTFAPRTEELIVVRQLKSQKQQERGACDLAMSAAELNVAAPINGEMVVTIPVHNIGTLDAVSITAELVSVSAAPVVLQKATIRRINAPLDLLPKCESVSFTIPARPGRYMIRISGKSGVPEITLVNNTIEFVH